MALSYIIAGFKRAYVRTCHSLGPLVAELQDVVDAQIYSQSLAVSFETGEQMTHKIYFPFAATIVRVRVEVTKALADTDAGTIQLKDSGGTNLTNGLATIPLSSALAVEATITPTTGLNVAKDSHIKAVTAKTTAGGKARLVVEYRMQTPAPAQP